MRHHDDDFWDKPMQPIDSDNPEDFYDYVAEWRDAQRQQRVIVWVAGAVLGLVIGLGILIFGVVR
jgi:hypothetical protein